jgi:UDP-glucose 4-epimerase
MRVAYMRAPQATNEIIFRGFRELLEFRIGDVRDEATLCPALRTSDVVLHAAALKQVPVCEYFPMEAVRTNVGGPENIVASIERHSLPVETVVGISTDKACKPVNVMGMTKAIQERVFIQGNIRAPGTRFVCVRYGNVLASRGSVIPLFLDQIRSGGPVTITTPAMTRFLLSLDDAVDTVFAALATAAPGETYIPRVSSARILDVASVLIGNHKVETVVTGLRPGEKIHEILVSEEEGYRTVERSKKNLALLPMLPELAAPSEPGAFLKREYSSADSLMGAQELRQLLGAFLRADNRIHSAGGDLM